MKIVVTNAQAKRDYNILESLEAGIVLTGGEIKSVRQGRVSLQESFARIEEGEIFLYNMHITPYEQASIFKTEPKRTRKLLLHKKEIASLYGKVAQRGLSLIPLKIYFKNNLAKIEIALGKGKREYDKRDAIKKRESDLEMRRALRLKRK